MKKKFDFEIPIFGSYLYCLMGYTPEEVLKDRDIRHIHKEARDITYLGTSLSESEGLTIRCMPENWYFIWISPKTKGSKQKNTIAHEVHHVVHGVLSDCGIELSEATREVYAYLTGWVTEKIYDNLA